MPRVADLKERNEVSRAERAVVSAKTPAQKSAASAGLKAAKAALRKVHNSPEFKNETQKMRVEERARNQREKGKLRKPNLDRDEDGILKAVEQGIDDANKDAKRKK